MTLELFHYVHCPYCVRVRMALGYLDLNWQSNVLPYDDEITPTSLTGTKMLPIMKLNERFMNESLSIIKQLDTKNSLQLESWSETDTLLNELGNIIHNLCMPYWIWTPEFNDQSREYFVRKKSAKRGPFDSLVKRRDEFEAQILAKLRSMDSDLKPFWNSSKFTIRDIGLASHLWGLFIVPEFRFPQRWHDYLMSIKNICKFNYHQDFWGTK